jgi:folylpolyglutamate synthase/dihydropteroate synthase
MISVSKNFTQAFARLRQMCQPGDEIIIFGSFVCVSALITKVSRLGTAVNVSINEK